MFRAEHALVPRIGFSPHPRNHIFYGINAPPILCANAVSEGKLTPIEASRVMGLIDSYRRTLELTEIEARLQALEIQSVP